MAKNKLIKSLLKSDMFFLQSHKNALYSISKFSKNNKNLYFLNLVDLIQSIKQFIRILQYLAKTKYSITLWSTNTFLLNILNNILKIKRVLTTSNIPRNCANKKFLNLYIMLNDLFHNASNTVKLLNQNNYNLCVKINSKVDFSTNGIYKIYNELNDLKKIIFFGALISQVLKK